MNYVFYGKERRLTIKESEYDKVQNTDDHRPVFYVLDLNRDHHTGCKHDGRYSKAISIGQVGQIRKNGDENNSKNQECPVGRGDVNLALDRLGRVEHAKRGESFGVDDLLDQGERRGNHRLRRDELENQN